MNKIMSVQNSHDPVDLYSGNRRITGALGPMPFICSRMDLQKGIFKKQTRRKEMLVKRLK